jgi:hypothetical protein
MKRNRLRSNSGSSIAEFPVGVGLVLFGTIVSVLLLGDSALVLAYKLRLAVSAGTIAANSSMHPTQDLTTGTYSTWNNWCSGWVSKVVENLQDDTTFYASAVLPYLGLPGVTMNNGVPIQLDTAGGVTLRTFTVPVSSSVPLILTGCSFIPNSANLQEYGAGVLTVDELPGAFTTIKAPQSNLPYNAGATPPTFGGTFSVVGKAYQSATVAGVQWYPGVAVPPQYTVPSGNPCVVTVVTTNIAPPTPSWIDMSPVD